MGITHLLTGTSALVESCFDRATTFIPERWYSKPEMIKNKNAYAPFAQGSPLVQFSLSKSGTNECVKVAIAA